MKKNILLITGWGGGEKLLEPLKSVLEQHGHSVTLTNTFNAFDQNTLANYVDLAIKSDVIAGWSLGGELAIILTNEVFNKTGQAKSLITMASNPSFVQAKHWPHAMSLSDFAAFKDAFEHDPTKTLKRFGRLVTKGVTTANSDFVHMQSMLKAQPLGLLRQGLNLLEQLNCVEILKTYKGNQLHLFAEQDTLVSSQVVADLQNLDAKFMKVVLFKQAAHSFPFIKIEETCAEILKFIDQSA